MALEIVPEFLHFKQSIPVAGHDFCITGQEAIVELLEGLEMSRGMADSTPLKIHGLATAPRPNINAANFVFSAFRLCQTVHLVLQFLP